MKSGCAAAAGDTEVEAVAPVETLESGGAGRDHCGSSQRGTGGELLKVTHVHFISESELLLIHLIVRVNTQG